MVDFVELKKLYGKVNSFTYYALQSLRLRICKVYVGCTVSNYVEKMFDIITYFLLTLPKTHAMISTQIEPLFDKKEEILNRK